MGERVVKNGLVFYVIPFGSILIDQQKHRRGGKGRLYRQRGVFQLIWETI